MNQLKEPFNIGIHLEGIGEKISLRVTHESETFDFVFQGKQVSIINNGDNSWSSIENELEQETINIIGAEIEKHFNSLSVK